MKWFKKLLHEKSVSPCSDEAVFPRSCSGGNNSETTISTKKSISCVGGGGRRTHKENSTNASDKKMTIATSVTNHRENRSSNNNNNNNIVGNFTTNEILIESTCTEEITTAGSSLSKETVAFGSLKKRFSFSLFKVTSRYRIKCALSRHEDRVSTNQRRASKFTEEGEAAATTPPPPPSTTARTTTTPGYNSTTQSRTIDVNGVPSAAIPIRRCAPATNDTDGSMEKTFSSTPINVKLARHAKTLERIISIDTVSPSSISSTSLHRSLQRSVRSPIVSREHKREIVDPDDFFHDPEEVLEYRQEVAIYREWCIVDDYDRFMERSPSCESFIDDEFSASFETTTFCGDPGCDVDDLFDTSLDEDSFVKVKKTPSVISLASYVDDEFGIFHDPIQPNREIPKIPEAFYYCSFDYDIQCGLPFDSKIYFVSAFEEMMEDTLRGSTALATSLKHQNNIKADNPTDSVEGKADAMGKSLMGPLLSSISPSACRNSECSVQKLFGLNDDGDIVINFDHITEEHGYGFMMKKNKRVYRSVEMGETIDEDNLMDSGGTMWVLLRRIWQQICRCGGDRLDGHPRNKTNSGSGPGDTIGAYALALANDASSTFSRNIENFISCTKDSRELAPQVVMRNMRQFMSGMKNYLVKHGEGDFQNEVLRARSRLKSDEFLNLDQILESVMHQLVVLPLKEHLYGLFVDYYTRTADIQLLVENVKYASSRTATDFGIRSSVSPPSSVAMHQISLLLLRLQEAELPLDKLEYLLAVVNAIFETTTHPRGQALGADDFLPLLVYIVAKCGFIGAEIEAEFMWCLLQQSLLNGEAGYYLTALCSAVHVLKSFMASENEGTGSLDIRSSSLPACSSVLRVIIPDEYNGSLQTRTLPVRPHTTTREVCRTIAHKARITNPQDYGLFKLVDGEETLLMDSECPQEARLAARGKHCMLAYKRIDAKIAWPTLTSN